MLFQFRPDYRAVEAWQSRAAWALFFLFLVLAVGSMYALKYRIRSDDERRHLRAIRPELLSKRVSEVHLRHSTPTPQRRETVLQALRSEPDPDPGVWETITRTYGDIVHNRTSVPPVVMRGILEALALMIVAGVMALAIVSIDGWLAPDGDLSVLFEVGLGIVAIVFLVGSVLVSILPGGELLLAFREPMHAIIAALVAALALVSTAILAQEYGRAYDVGWWALLGHARELSSDGNEISPGLGTALRRAFAKLLLVRAVFWIVRAGAAVILVGVTGIAVFDGHALAALLTLVEIGPIGWVVLATMPFLVAVVITAMVPDRASELRLALGRSLRSAVVRTRWLLFGAPVLAVVLTILIVATFTESWLYTAGAAVLIGSVVRMVTALYARVRYRVPAADPVERVDEVAITGYQVTDADGQEIHILQIDEHQLAHRDLETLAQTGVDAISWRLDGPTTTDGGGAGVFASGSEMPKHMPTVERHYFEEATKQGRVDFDAVRESVRGDVETRIKATIREHGGEADRQKMLDELQDEYPAAIVSESIEFLRDETAQVYESDGKFVLR